MSTCRECHNDEAQCGPLSRAGECLECELSAETARELAVLKEQQESGWWECERRYSPSEGWRCPECGGSERLSEMGVSMCANCGRIEQEFA